MHLRWSITKPYLVILVGGPDMAPKPPNVRTAPGHPWRSSISVSSAPRYGPQTPQRSDRPGTPVALLYLGFISAPMWPPNPPTFGPPRETRGAPLSRFHQRPDVVRTSHQTRTPVRTITTNSIRLRATPDSRWLASPPSCAPGRAPRATSSAGTSGT